MEPTLLFTFGVLTFLCAVVAIDEMLERSSTLGEEWDFLTPLNRKNIFSLGLKNTLPAQTRIAGARASINQAAEIKRLAKLFSLLTEKVLSRRKGPTFLTFTQLGPIKKRSTSSAA